MRMAVAAASVALVLFFSCGRGGDGGDDGDEEEVDDDGGTVQPEITDVFGKFYYGSTSQPAVGSELWVLNHTGIETSTFELDEQGAFEIPLAFFTEDHVYSFHLVKQRQLIGNVDLAPDVDGSQTAFTYRGGYGFDMGEITVPLDRHGAIDLAAGVTGSIGGGFSLITSFQADFSTFPIPDWLSAVAVGNHLVISDASVLLTAFYLRDTHPVEYGQALAAWNRIGALVVSKEKEGVGRVIVEEGVPWLEAARIANSIEIPPEQAPLWSDTDLELPKRSPFEFRASAYLGRIVDQQALMTLRVASTDGIQVAVPRVVPRRLSMPPKVVGASAQGSGVAAVAYDSDSAQNGLSRPFCQSSTVVLELSPPLDEAGQPVPATTLNRIDVEFDYFKKVGGQAPRLKAVAKSFAAPYNKDYSDELTDMTRTWTIATQRLRFAVGETAGAAATQTITIDPKLLPAKIGADNVGKIRLRVYYRSETDATEGGSVVWLNKGC